MKLVALDISNQRFCDETCETMLTLLMQQSSAPVSERGMACGVTSLRARAREWQTIDHYGFPDYPNGQLRADARSMAVLLAAVSSGGSTLGTTLLETSSVDEMLRVQAPQLDEEQGLMWYQWQLDGETVIGHNGGEVGVSAEILFRQSDGRGVVVLMNSEGGRSTLEDVEIAALGAL